LYFKTARFLIDMSKLGRRTVFFTTQ